MLEIIDFALILLDVFLGYVLGIGAWCFPCVAVALISFSWITCYLSCLINRDIWRGIFAASSGRLCWIFKCLFLSSQYLLVFRFTVAYCRAILFLCTGRNLFDEYFFLDSSFYLSWLIYI